MSHIYTRYCKAARQRGFPGGPVARTQHFHCWDMGLIPGQGAKILQVMCCSCCLFAQSRPALSDPTDCSLGLPGSSDGKEFACNAGDLSLTPESGRSPGGGHGNPLQFSGLENPHGQRSLAGYSPKGCKESDPTE